MGHRRAGRARPRDGEHDPDAELLRRTPREPAAFAEFYDRNLPAVLGWFATRTGSAHLAVELTAETFAQALAGAHRYDAGEGTGRAWLFGIAANQHHRYLRRGSVDRRYRTRVEVLTPEVTTDDVERIEDLVDARERLAELAAALDGLSQGVREAVVLRIGEELPYGEVAARLGCSEGLARQRVARGLARLMLAMVPQ